MPNRLQHWIADRSSWFLALTALLTLLALAQLIDLRKGSFRLSVDPSLETISTLSQSDRDYEELIRLRFGNREPVMVVLRVDDIYTLENLAGLDRLSYALAALEGVESVRSLTVTRIPRVEEGILNYARLTEEALRDPGTPGSLRSATRDNPLIEGQLVSADGRSAAVLVYPEPKSEKELMESRLAERILQVMDAVRTGEAELLATGSLIIRSEISDTVARQLGTVVPLIILVITLLLALVFRTLRGVLIPLASVTIALIWVLATLSFLGRPINLMTALVPPFIVTMGLAYCAHVLTEYEHLIRIDDQPDAITRIARLLQAVSVPVIVTGLATMAGLFALMLNDQSAMIEFAWLSIVGTAYLLLLTLTFVPSLLCLIRPGVSLKPLPAQSLFDGAVERISRFNQQWRAVILRVAIGVFLLCILLASHIEIGDVFVGVFPEDTRVRMDYEKISETMGGATPLDIALEGDTDDLFTDPKILSYLDGLQAWLKDQPEVGSVIGLTDHVKLLSRYLDDNSDGEISQSQDAIRQMLFVGEGELLRGVVNIDRSATLIQVRLVVDDTTRIEVFLNRLESRLDQLPAGVSARLTGGAYTMTESVREATSGQLLSIALALLLIYLCLALQFMSLKIGLLATLPTALQTAIYFGILGLLGVSLNPTSVLVEVLILGLAIDDTIHYLARFARSAKRSGSEVIAAKYALHAVLRPVTVTKAILALGFLTMLTGELNNQAQFGWLAALTLFCAWIVDILVTPAFMGGLRIVTLWDTLRLNLGERVQQTIPLFKGLNNRQARIFALMSNLHTLPAGTRLITEGEEAGNIYVVVDGELSVSQGSGDGAVEINRMKRGDVIGEVGYFGQRRSANVDTMTRTRLLRFDEEDQERLCVAYPAIALRVFLNLNRIQAERQARHSLMREQLNAGQ